jgi:hypothetical protein
MAFLTGDILTGLARIAVLWYQSPPYQRNKAARGYLQEYVNVFTMIDKCSRSTNRITRQLLFSDPIIRRTQRGIYKVFQVFCQLLNCEGVTK